MTNELPPDRSIVAIKSCLYGTYLAACPDYMHVTLKKVSDPNKLPQNCLWTLRRKVINYDNKPWEILKFKSCYGRYLAAKGFIWLDLRQDEIVTSVSRLADRIFTYDRGGATEDDDGYRLIVMKDEASLLYAKKYYEVKIRSSAIILSMKPDVYWTIHRVGSDDKRPSLVEDEDEDKDECFRRRFGKGITIINNNAGVPYYNHSTVIDSGKNVNLDGNQCNGGVIAGNKNYAN